ncbi:MAG: Nif3-like dinuclear metal center hexameric protein [Candidatus Woesearchaeota archaeon]
MELKKLVDILENDFIKPNYTDVWDYFTQEVEENLTDNFKKRKMGLMFEFSDKVDKVYTSTFPSKEALSKIEGENIFWFSHHAANWDIRKENVFEYLDKDSLDLMKKRKISLYVLHVPLDDDHKYGTSVCLGEELGLKKSGAFFNYGGALAATLNDEHKVYELANKCEELVGHDIGFYKYGDGKGKVSVVGGGGFNKRVFDEMLELGSNTLITGITVLNKHNNDLHEFCMNNKINVIGLTHYSSEKFACIKMVDYFKDLGLNAEFISETPVLEDV